MVNIVHVDFHCDDQKKITALETKIKCPINTEAPLVAAISTAFYKTTLLADVGKSLATELDEERKNIVDMKVCFRKDNNLTFADMANFLKAFQEALDEISL